MTPARRLGVVVMLVAIVAAGFAIDRVERPEPEGDDAVALAARMPTASPLRALSSTWFCAAATGNPGQRAEVSLIAANPTADNVNAVVTLVAHEGDPQSIPVVVPARGSLTVNLAEHRDAPYLAATVDADVGGVVVEQQVRGPAGTSVAPCASSGSEEWFFADGSTAREDTMLLSLYNPFPEDAIVDMSFTTDQGREVPQNLQGIVVKGGRVAVVNVSDHVRRRNRLAGTVATRSGRLVVTKVQARGGAAKGISASLAAPSAGQQWWFADGYATTGIIERFAIYNPTNREATVSVDLVLDEGATEPFDLTIPPRARLDIAVNDEERVPKGVAHSAIVTSTNGVPVVAERAVVATTESNRAGTSESLGSRTATARWLLAAGSASESSDEWVTVLNTGTSPVQVSITALAAGQLLAVEGLEDLAVGAGRRRSFRLTDHIRRDDLPLLVEATGGPVVVERSLYAVAGLGLSLSPGVPLR
ncbi:MAG TPA: DUF5719 family protein [Acidimicrobiales bacterium]